MRTRHSRAWFEMGGLLPRRCSKNTRIVDGSSSRGRHGTGSGTRTSTPVTSYQTTTKDHTTTYISNSTAATALLLSPEGALLGQNLSEQSWGCGHTAEEGAGKGTQRNGWNCRRGIQRGRQRAP